VLENENRKSNQILPRSICEGNFPKIKNRKKNSKLEKFRQKSKRNSQSIDIQQDK